MNKNARKVVDHNQNILMYFFIISAREINFDGNYDNEIIIGVAICRKMNLSKVTNEDIESELQKIHLLKRQMC